jgi:PAS domain S-box-containing protein
MAPAVALAALAVNVHAGGGIWVGAMFAAGNTVGPGLAAWLMWRWGMDSRLSSRKDVTLFLVAAALGMLVSATNGVAALWLAGLMPASAAGTAWRSWWVGDAMGVVLGAVPLLTMPAGSSRTTTRMSARAIELALLLGGLLLVAALLFGLPSSAEGHPALPLLFVPFMFVAFLALRSGLFVSSLAILGVALAAALGTALGRGPFAGPSVHVGLLALWGYIAALAGTTMLICVLVEELDLTRKRMLAMFAHAHDGVLLLDTSDHIVEANPAAARLLGSRQASLLGMPLWRLEPDATAQDSVLRSVLAQPPQADEEKSTLHVGQLVRADGSRFDADIEFSRYVDSPGVLRAHMVFRDITDRLRAESERRKAEAAERANRAKTEFLSRMSHELRTPLNAVLGFAQLLERDAADLPPRQRQQVEHIARAGEHLLRLINEVLDLNRIEAGAVSLQLAPTPLAQVATDALSLLRGAADARGVKLEGPSISAEGGSRLYAWADTTRVQEVLVNLLDNAIKYTARGGRVWLRLHDDGGKASPVVVEVADTGRGISAEQLEHLFEPFNRLGAQHSDDGIGIGLVISRHLIEIMQGRLLVQSTLGQGSVFRVELPRAAADAADSAPVPTPWTTPASTGHTIHVLYVEDNEVNALLVHAMLASHSDVRLSIAANGAEGLEIARRTPPDLMLIEMHLPDMTGLDVLRALRAMPGLADVPCIAASADAMPETIAGALEAGFDAYLTKPLSLSEFNRCVGSHFRAHRRLWARRGTTEVARVE